MSNSGGSLHINNNNYSIAASTLTQIIDSFSKPLNYSFSIERLPLDDLLVNNTIVESSQCTSKQNSWLNCLQSNTIQVTLPRCSTSYKLNLSYVNNKYQNEYLTGSPTSVTIPKPSLYEPDIVFQCKCLK